MKQPRAQQRKGNTMKADDLISDSVIYEAYFHLWGFSVNWITAGALLELVVE